MQIQSSYQKIGQLLCFVSILALELEISVMLPSM